MIESAGEQQNSFGDVPNKLLQAVTSTLTLHISVVQFIPCVLCAAEKTDIMGRYAARVDNTRLRQMHPHWLKHRRGPDDASLLRMDSLLDAPPPDSLAVQVCRVPALV